tara:strand:+ start:173 stop:448 length:276 start_codon:yes stop_codon:yes gene_type:complete
MIPTLVSAYQTARITNVVPTDVEIYVESVRKGNYVFLTGQGTQSAKKNRIHTRVTDCAPLTQVLAGATLLVLKPEIVAKMFVTSALKITKR